TGAAWVGAVARRCATAVQPAGALFGSTIAEVRVDPLFTARRPAHALRSRMPKAPAIVSSAFETWSTVNGRTAALTLSAQPRALATTPIADIMPALLPRAIRCTNYRYIDLRRLRDQVATVVCSSRERKETAGSAGPCNGVRARGVAAQQGVAGVEIDAGD